LTATLLLCVPSKAEESAADFFRKDLQMRGDGIPPDTGGSRNVGTREKANTVQQNAVAQKVADATRRKLGEKYVDSMLRLTKLESGFRCHVRGPSTRHGRAVGPLQVMPGSAVALGISVKDLNSSCDAQIEAGLRHAAKCISVGAVTHSQLAACHVAGWGGWNKRLRGKHEAYKQKYIRLAAATPNQRRRLY
jgi:hypothetical protein